MTNILIDKLPEYITIEDQKVLIDSDFRSCLSTILAFEDEELSNQEKYEILLLNTYTTIDEFIQIHVEEAIRQAILFLNGGKDEQINETENNNQPMRIMRLYSFGKDADYIFSAFRQTHGIDLNDIDYMHWWKFLAYFMDLGSDTTFSGIVNLRKRIKTGKATKEERAAAREMKSLFDLSDYDNRTDEQKERYEKFMAAVKEGERLREAEKTKNK